MATVGVKGTYKSNVVHAVAYTGLCPRVTLTAEIGWG